MQAVLTYHSTDETNVTGQPLEPDRAAGDTTPLVLSVIMPAYRCVEMLRASLAGLVASDLPRSAWELIVVDDGSPDATPDLARTVADRVLVTPDGPRGPAFARNLGAIVAQAPVLLFVDSDVVVAPHTLSGFARVFRDRPDVSAVFGAYDESPGDAGFVSQYRNLLHHYVHRMNPGEASTFWAGCGAVRRDAFLAVGGYDHRRYPRPQIEDIELGYRLRANDYRIELAPELQGRHLKRWTLSNMIRTDVRERALPWMHLILERGESLADGPLNLQVREKLLTALSLVMVSALIVGIARSDWRWIAVGATAALAIALGNLALIRWFAAVRGLSFALRVLPMRVIFYLTSAVGAAAALFSYSRRRRYGALPPLSRTDERFSTVGALHV